MKPSSLDLLVFTKKIVTELPLPAETPRTTIHSLAYKYLSFQNRNVWTLKLLFGMSQCKICGEILWLIHWESDPCNNGYIFCHLHCSAICMSINISIFLVADIMICNYLIINAPSAYRSHCRKLFLILIDTNSNVINQF